MKTQMRLGGSLAIALIAFAMAVEGRAQERKGPDPSRQDMARMEAMVRAGTPGQAHKRLDPLVGRFSVTMKMWMDPAGPPQESTAVSVNKWVLGDRFVQQQLEGTSSGEASGGVGYIGYDNLKKKYTSVWMDSTSTAMFPTTGSFDPEGKVLTFTGTADDPATGKPVKTTVKLLFAGRDSHTVEVWGPDPTGKPYKMMEIAYSRE